MRRSVPGNRRPGHGPTVLMSVLALLVGLLAAPGSATSNYVAFRVLGQVDFDSSSTTSQNMNQPMGVFLSPSGHVLAADSRNHRVLVWSSMPSVNGALPDAVLGQADLAQVQPNRGGPLAAHTLRCPSDVWSDGARVLVADRGNNRVLIWDSLLSSSSLISGAPADRVLGQVSFDSGPAASGDACAPEMFPATSSNLSRPHAVTSDGSRILVSDTFNHRVLIWQTMTPTNGQAADVVLGQGASTESEPNRGGPVGADTLTTPVGLHVWDGRLYVADTGNHRVLGFDGIPTSTGAPASFVLGQPDMSSGSPNAGRSAPSNRGFNAPIHVSSNGDILVVTDHFNHRALVFRPLATANFPAAVDEIGHGRFTSDGVGSGDKGLLGPWGVSLGASGILIGDSGNHRGMVFRTPLSASASAVTAVAPTGSRSIQISWPSQQGATGYRIYRDGFWFADVDGGQTTSYTDSGLSADTYSYSVHVLSDENRLESGSLGTVSATASGSAPPLTVSATDGFDYYLAEGDSIAAAGAAPGYPQPEESYPLQLGTYLGVPHFNASVPGSSCSDVAGRLPSEIARFAPDLVTLGVGANDLSGGWADTMGIVNMSSYRTCLEGLIGTVAPGPDRMLLLFNFTHQVNWTRTDPAFSPKAPDVGDAAGSDAKRRAWNKVVRDVAADRGVPLVDVTTPFDDLMAADPSDDYLLGDRVHLDQGGLDVVSQAALDLLRTFLTASSPVDAPGRPVPEADRVDPSNGGTTPVGVAWAPSDAALRTTAPYEIQWSSSRSFDGSSGVSTTFSSEPATTLSLPDGKTYMRVRAWSSDGMASDWSLWGRVLVGDPVPYDGQPPGPPGRPVASAGRGTTDPVWTWEPAPDDSGIQKYMICFWLAHGPRVEDADHCFFTQEPEYRHPSPFSGGVWYANVAAWDLSGNRGPYSELGVWFSTGLV